MTDIAGHYERTLIADRAAIDEESRTVSASLSTESPVERFFGAEVLEHQARNVDLERASPSLPLLFNHDPNAVIGSVENVRLDGGKLRGRLRFAKTGRGNEIFELVRDGHLRGISIGYQVIDGVRDGETDDGLPLFRITKWRLFEATVSPLPADNKAGIGRSMKRGNTMDTEELNEETEGKSRSQRRRENRARQLENEILEIGDAFGERELAERTVLEGGTEADLRKAILAKRQTPSNTQPIPGMNRGDGMFRDAMPEFGRTVSASRAKLLPAFGENREEQRETAFRAGQWILGHMFGNEYSRQWCQNYGVRAMSEGIFSKGGATVPVELSSAIIDLQEMYGIARQECEVMPMNSDMLAVPRHTGGVTAYFVGENTEITSSDAEWDDVNLVARKLAALTRVSTELAEDSVIDIAAFLANEFGKRFAEKEDDCLWNGDGTSTYGGIVGVRPKLIDGNHAAGAVDATSGDNTLPEIVAGDLDTLMSKLPQYALTNAKWYCSQTANQLVFQAIARAAGGASVVETGNTIVRSYSGYPIVVSQKLPNNATTSYDGEAMILFGDLRQAAMMGTRREIRIRVLEERYAELDQLGVQGTERFDINVHDLGDGTDAGPIVGLVGNA